MRLARRQQKVHQTSGRIAYAHDLGAEAAARATQRFAAMARAANESQTQLGSLPGRAPEAF